MPNDQEHKISVAAAGFTFVPADYPRTPGVYLMKNASGRIIYVGKANSLRARLSSYFRSPKGHSTKTRALVSHIASVDILHSTTEKEALLLEASLIKKHKPRYNVVLRDDKQYILFKLDKRHEFPRLVLTRKVVRDGSVYFGPLTSGAAAKVTWKLLGKVFPLRKCTDRAFRNRVRPCLYHHIGQCMGPCVNEVDRVEYRSLVRRVEMFLSGRTGELVSMLEGEMKEAAQAMEYERAARLRDQIRAVERTVERQVAVLNDNSDRDVLGLAEVEKGLGLGLLFIRQGRLIDEKHFFWPGLSLDEAREVVESFLAQFYAHGRFVPSRFLLPFEVDPVLEQMLADKREGHVRVADPVTLREKELVDLARKVASRARETENSITPLLQRALRLEREPQRIECIDASHLSGTDMRVGQVVFEDGERVPDHSRLYSFPELEGAADDYAALSAWAKRRIESGPPWPDLVLIDGGKGQLAAVEAAFEDCPDSAFELASIAKGPTRKAGELADRIFRPGRSNPMPLKPGSKELLFLQRVRDEAHRFVISGQRKARSGSESMRSTLINLPGVGPKTAKLLWDHFDSVRHMAEAGPDGLAALPGIGRKKAEALHGALRELVGL